MRRFFSYGPINKELHYHVPRRQLIDFAKQQLLGDTFANGGHYMTVWAPRQRGKTWIMGNVLRQLQTDARLDVLKLNIQPLQSQPEAKKAVQYLADLITQSLQIPRFTIHELTDFADLFTANHLSKPLILIIDEFDALQPDLIRQIVAIFRNIYIARQESPLPTEQKPYLLHGVALIGVMAVLGVDNPSGSPFNIQRSMPIPNLTYDEVNAMFHQYIDESGQAIDQAVIDRLYHVLQGQPGLTGWFGELLTETYNQHQPTIAMTDFELVYKTAVQALPNANILNIVSKAKTDPYRETVLNLFETDEKQPFKYDNPHITYLYLNGVIDEELDGTGNRVMRFPCQFVQERLFNYFSGIFDDMDRLYNPFIDLSDIITETTINLKNILRLYEAYIQQNKGWLFKQAPRRQSDLRIMEATYHFSLFTYLKKFMQAHYSGNVVPEFPTGNGKVDLLLTHNQQPYVLELKSFSTMPKLKEAIVQAAGYGKSLKLPEVTLVMFVEAIPPDMRQKLETKEIDPKTGVLVEVVLVEVVQ